MFGDVRIKRLSLEKSRALAASEPVPISHEAKSEVIHALKEAFEASNQRLEEVVGAKLPPEYFDLRF